MSEKPTPQEYWDEFGSIDGAEWEDVEGAIQIGTEPVGCLVLVIDGEYHEAWYDSPDNRWCVQHQISEKELVTTMGDIDLTEIAGDDS